MDFARKVDPSHERLAREITYEDCMGFLRRWRDQAPSTYSSAVSLLRGFFGFLEEYGHIPASPAARLKRRKRQNACTYPSSPSASRTWPASSAPAATTRS